MRQEHAENNKESKPIMQKAGHGWLYVDDGWIKYWWKIFWAYSF
jgi:hypothetical protein